MLKKYKFSMTIEAFQWDGTEKQLNRYKLIQQALSDRELELNVCDEFTEEKNIPVNLFDYDGQYIEPGDYVVLNKKTGGIILTPKKEFNRYYKEIIKHEKVFKVPKNYYNG